MKFLKRNKNVLITFLLLFLTVSLISLAVFNKNENTTYEINSESYAVADKELSEEIKTDLKEEAPIQKENKQKSSLLSLLYGGACFSLLFLRILHILFL